MYETTNLVFVLAILYKMATSVYALMIVDKIIVQQVICIWDYWYMSWLLFTDKEISRKQMYSKYF